MIDRGVFDNLLITPENDRVIGTTVGSYRITAKLSVGGMGTVYKAEHQLIGKLTAVKILHPELSGNRDIVNRFFNEAKMTAAINHPGIVEVIEFGYMDDGHAFLVMEFLEGMSLARRMRTRGKCSQGEAAVLLRQVCSALGAAHAKNIVHRDLKPDNIYMVPDPDSPIGERAKVLDFGIAKLTDIGFASTATKTGAVMGTPTYMSPEQCRGTGIVDHRADLYSIGCIFYELVTGRPPFTNLGAGELIGAHLFVQPEPPTKHEPSLSKETEALIMRLLSKEPDKRPQTSHELANMFAALARGQGFQVTSTTPFASVTPPLGSQTIRDSGPPAAMTSVLPSGSHDAAHDDDHDDEDADAAATKTMPSHPSLTKLGTPAPFVAVISKTPVPPTNGDPAVELRTAAVGPTVGEDAPLRTEQPTTLSGAASHSMVDLQAPKRRSWGWFAAAAVILLGAGVGGVLSMTTHGNGAGATAAAVSPASELPPSQAPTPAPPTPPLPQAASVTPTPTPPTPPTPPAAVADPMPTPAAAPPSAAVKAIAVKQPMARKPVHVAATSAPAKATPMAKKPAVTTSAPATTTPTTTTPAKPAPTKPALIETDI